MEVPLSGSISTETTFVLTDFDEAAARAALLAPHPIPNPVPIETVNMKKPVSNKGAKVSVSVRTVGFMTCGTEEMIGARCVI